MYMRAAMMLPLKPHPVVSNTKHSNIVGLDELLDSAVEEPVRDGWILNDSLGTAGSEVRVIWSQGHLGR